MITTIAKKLGLSVGAASVAVAGLGAAAPVIFSTSAPPGVVATAKADVIQTVQAGVFKNGAEVWSGAVAEVADGVYSSAVADATSTHIVIRVDDGGPYRVLISTADGQISYFDAQVVGQIAK